MSNWLRVSGYMVVTDNLSCKFAKNYDINDDDSPVPELAGYKVNDVLGAIFVTMRNKCLYKRGMVYNPFNYIDAILWMCGCDVVDRELFEWDKIMLDDETSLLEALRVPNGSEGPINITITPQMDEYGTKWHIVFDGSLRDREINYKRDIEKWWKAIQMLLTVERGYISATWGLETWEDKIFHEFS